MHAGKGNGGRGRVCAGEPDLAAGVSQWAGPKRLLRVLADRWTITGHVWASAEGEHRGHGGDESLECVGLCVGRLVGLSEPREWMCRLLAALERVNVVGGGGCRASHAASITVAARAACSDLPVANSRRPSDSSTRFVKAVGEGRRRAWVSQWRAWGLPQ